MAPPTEAVQVVVVSCITVAMAIVATMLRLWSRYLQNQSLVTHDYLALAGMLFTAASVAILVAGGFAAGLGFHTHEVTATAPETVTLRFKLFILCSLLWATANSCVKLSILSFYITLFPNKLFIRLCHGTMFATALYLILLPVKNLGLCTPLQHTWDKTTDGVCIGENELNLLVCIVNFVMDACILVLPMPLVFRLQMTLTRRINVAGMFSLGALICIISLLRTIWIPTWDQSKLTYNNTAGIIFVVLSPTLGVVNACLPTIMPAVAKLFGPRAVTPAGRAPQVPCRTIRSVKGNITREIERLDDEFPLYEIHIEAGDYAESDFGSPGSSDVHVDRGSGVAHDPSAAV